MEYEDNPRSIKYYVKKYLLNNKDYFKGKTVIDFPAGNGITSRILNEIGAKPLAFDLFPEYFTQPGITCIQATIATGIPLQNNHAAALICQEGIEHFSDQAAALREFSRVLKKGGRLLITTPNYSNIRAKLSYLLMESERFNSKMPPNELDSIWMNKQELTNEIYYGHIFLIGIQKLRLLSRLAGFKIVKVHLTEIKNTSLLLLPLFYPFILLSNGFTYLKNMRKNKQFDNETKRRVYGEIFQLSINIRTLICGHLMIEFEKENDTSEVSKDLKSIHQGFGIT